MKHYELIRASRYCDVLLAFCQRPPYRKSSALYGSFVDWHIADVSSGRPEEQVCLVGQLFAVPSCSVAWFCRGAEDLRGLDRGANQRGRPTLLPWLWLSAEAAYICSWLTRFQFIRGLASAASSRINSRCVRPLPSRKG